MRPAFSLLNAARHSASSRNFDLNGKARTHRAKRNSPIIPPAYAIPTRHHNRMRFSVHTGLELIGPTDSRETQLNFQGRCSCFEMIDLAMMERGFHITATWL